MQDAANSKPPPERRGVNRVDNESLRRVELPFFGALILALSGALAYRGILIFLDGRADFPIIGLQVPGLPGILAGAAYLALSVSVALACVAMVIRFRK
ncbi:MAG: hypothetical protein ACYTFG_17895 [Planctomycetota bacterium]